LRKFFCWGASTAALKSILLGGCIGVKGGYNTPAYNNMGDMRPPSNPPPFSNSFQGGKGGGATARHDEPCLGNRRFSDREMFGKP
jgi:hypothetical protein